MKQYLLSVYQPDGEPPPPPVLENISAGKHLFHAIRADLLQRLGRNAEAGLAYESAIDRCENATERAFLQRRRDR